MDNAWSRRHGRRSDAVLKEPRRSDTDHACIKRSGSSCASRPRDCAPAAAWAALGSVGSRPRAGCWAGLSWLRAVPSLGLGAPRCGSCEPLPQRGQRPADRRRGWPGRDRPPRRVSAGGCGLPPDLRSVPFRPRGSLQAGPVRAGWSVQHGSYACDRRGASEPTGSFRSHERSH